MTTFNQICKQFENIDADTYSAILVEKAASVLPALAAITEDETTGVTVFANFILASIAADGKLTEEEYLLSAPLLKAFFGDNIDYSLCKSMIASMKKETKIIKKSVDEMVDLLGKVSEELKADIILVCMLICAVDGKISLKEKNWIKQLIKD